MPFENEDISLDAQGRLNFSRECGAANAERIVRLSMELLPLPTEYRGSRKHVLDLLETLHWQNTLTQVIGINELRVPTQPFQIPVGYESAAETDLDEYVCNLRHGTWPEAEISLNQGAWWAPNGGRRPQMDLICRIKIGNRDGLLFVEAKAHEGELDWGGKQLADDATEGSIANHENIQRQVTLANTALNELCGPGFNLSINSHYQFVNRLTYLWKLASVGIPVVLLYLGFTKDRYFNNDFLRDDRHWQRLMGGYMQGIAPQGFPEKKIILPNGASIQMLVRSCDIQPSPQSH